MKLTTVTVKNYRSYVGSGGSSSVPTLKVAGVKEKGEKGTSLILTKRVEAQPSIRVIVTRFRPNFCWVGKRGNSRECGTGTSLDRSNSRAIWERPLRWVK
jgi:hypothetical protein